MVLMGGEEVFFDCAIDFNIALSDLFVKGFDFDTGLGFIGDEMGVGGETGFSLFVALKNVFGN